MYPHWPGLCFFFFNDTATTEIYTLSLHDALPILIDKRADVWRDYSEVLLALHETATAELALKKSRSEEHTSELQSPDHLVCRLLLEKKKSKSQRCSNHRQPLAPRSASKRCNMVHS